MAETVKLRGHHLLCILPYVGEGYTSAFVDNFDAIVAQVNRGAQINIVSGPDDICASLRRGAATTCAHANICRKQSVRHRDNLALRDVGRALQMPMLKTGDSLKIGKGEAKHLRRYFAHGAIRRACMSCAWHGFCSQIAADNFSGTKLFPSPG